MTDAVLDRFLHGVVIDTQSDVTSQTQPSTLKQLEPQPRVLLDELKATRHRRRPSSTSNGYIYATIPAQHREVRSPPSASARISTRRPISPA